MFSSTACIQLFSAYAKKKIQYIVSISEEPANQKNLICLHLYQNPMPSIPFGLITRHRIFLEK
jgi:hypothetical protein